MSPTNYLLIWLSAVMAVALSAWIGFLAGTQPRKDAPMTPIRPFREPPPAPPGPKEIPVFQETSLPPMRPIGYRDPAPPVKIRPPRDRWEWGFFVLGTILTTAAAVDGQYQVALSSGLLAATSFVRWWRS